MAEAGRSVAQPAARSSAERSLRRSSWPRSEPPCFPHRLVRLDGVPKLLAPDDIKKLEVAARPRPRPRLQPYASRLQSCVCTLQPNAPRRGATRSSAPTMRRCRASSPKARPPASSTPRCAARRLLWLLARFASESLERTSSLHVYHLEPRYRLLYT